MNYYLKQGAQEAYLKIGDLISDAGATAQIFAIADNPKLVFKKFRDPAEAHLMEPKITQMVNNLPSEDLKEIGAGSLSIHSLAWPTHCVYGKGQFAGFLMPYIDHSSSLSLNKIFSSKAREKNGITEDLRWRIYVARNLVAVYHTLHQSGYFVIDTKPANIRTYKDSPAVSILDCDGFRHKGDTSATGFITEEYIAPTSIGKPFSELGGEQDLFAVSILVFQILNNGIHPFQGIQNKSTSFTTQQLIEKKAYPYGDKPPLVLKPSPISCHSLFPDELRAHFDKIFSGNSRAKSVQGLLDILDDLKEGKGLNTCIRPGHTAFKKGCPSCFVSDLASGAKAPKKSQSADDTQPSRPPHQPTNPTRPPPKSKSSGLGWIFFGVIVAVGLLVGLSPSNQSKSTSYSSSQSSSSNANTSKAVMSNELLCSYATQADPNNLKWVTGGAYIRYVQNAKARSLHCGVATSVPNDELCRLALRGGDWEIRTQYIQYVTEAKRRGLGCGIQTNSSNRSNSNVADSQMLSNLQVCVAATTGGPNNVRWKSGSAFRESARARGLPCGVPSEYSGEQLCRLATRNGAWETQKKFLQYVMEAKRQGISCGIIEPDAVEDGLLSVVMGLSDPWFITKWNGTCVVVARYSGNNTIYVTRTSQGNFNAKYEMELSFENLFESRDQMMIFRPDNSSAISYQYSSSLDPDNSAIRFGQNVANQLKQGNSLSISSNLSPIEYKFPLKGSAAALEKLAKGECK